ncbi:Phosphatidic acid phosphatase type 2/haloperoxidase [Penicillium argentinense]|uniref:Phosphatidic acid phosphatase type 2/haloperoxidase n=1 Tax=Penicillium argentinense TaxID=1131581 RepID=A0A9W9G213_9EURO|nr:Phosphatidic acid phosphatase type 2/haloperoxidase [Penicillium argentinense]KAJ5110523.1 Phosphatidic acid phosphatase type 2/haloperoxidase [Penicillium argentinense]
MPLAAALARISKLLVLSYIIDWIFIMCDRIPVPSTQYNPKPKKLTITSGTALIGYGFSKVEPNKHPFSLTDATIAYPYDETETVSTAALVLTGLMAPAIIILAIALITTPAQAGNTRTSYMQLFQSKIWEWNAGWMGLASSLAGAWMATEGLKELVGKPRPDLLARCNPNLNAIEENMVGGLGVAGAPIIVAWTICQDQSDTLRIGGFQSFPSGHASFAFAGLGYLTLWLSAKFSISFPYLPSYPVEGTTQPHTDESSVRFRGAAPPVLMMLLAFVPTATASFIAVSRWADNRHHGFDVLFGSALGIVFAYIGFRMYHLPIQRGAGWAWGPRAPRRAFIRGVGVPTSLGVDSWAYSYTSGPEETLRQERVLGNGTGFDVEANDSGYGGQEEVIPMREQGHGHGHTQA